MKQTPITIVCVGQPNVGKSSLINKICGSNLKVGNFTGVTVEKSEACITYKGYKLRIIDLPGTYSLNDYSFEERVTKQFLETQPYDVILNVLDSTNLERCLYLTTQLLELNSRLCLALNMSDEAKSEGISIDTQLLGGILGVECVSVSAFYGDNLNALLDTLIRVAKAQPKPSKRVYADFLEHQIEALHTFLAQKRYPEIEALLSYQGALRPIAGGFYQADEVAKGKVGQGAALFTPSFYAQRLDSELYALAYQSPAQHRAKRYFSLRDVAVALLKQESDLSGVLHDKGCWVELSLFVQKCIDELYAQSEDKNMRDIFNNDALSFARGACLESSRAQKRESKTTTQKIDSVLLNKYLGIPIFLFLMWVLFQITFYLGEFPKVWIEDSAAALGDLVEESVPFEFLASLLSGGIIAGVGAVLSFLPHILILFCGIVLLEGTGYMARVAFLLDGFFHKFGLHGKSFIPLVTGFGCSVPAFMSARMLKNQNDRMLTLFIINFMSCGARLPVYTLFIGAFFSPEYAGNILYGIYILGALVGLCMAKILKLTAFRGDDEPFVMEMPKYRLPSLQLIAFSVWRKATSYVKKAGTFILLASVIIWVGTQFPHNEALQAQVEAQIAALEQSLEQKLESLAALDSENGADSQKVDSEKIEKLDSQKAEIEAQIAQITHAYQSSKVEQSYLGRIGRFIQPLFAPMDFDWKISVSLLNGLLAKETIISSMGVLYSLGDEISEDNDAPLRDVLQAYVSLPSAVAFILFIMFYNPCFAASIVFGKEAGGKRYIFYLFAFTSVVSYVFALCGYYIALALMG